MEQGHVRGLIETRKISVSQEQYDRYMKKIQNSKLTPKMFLHSFEGDDFKTKIWLEDGKLMAEDPTGIREIVAMKYENGRYIYNGQAQEGVLEINTQSKKAVLLDMLLKQGVPTEQAIQLSILLSRNQ